MSRHRDLLTQEERADERVSWYIGAFFICSAANMTMKTVLTIPENMWSTVSLFWGVIIMFFMLRGIRYVINRSSRLIIWSLLITLFLYLWSYFLISYRGEPTTVLTSAIGIPTLLFWLPVGIYASSVRNLKVLYQVMLKTSYILTAILVVCFLYRDNVAIYGEEARSYNMFLGYSMAFSSLFQLNEYYRTKRTHLLLLVLAQFIVILLYANRGALLSIAFFVCYKVIFDQLKIYKKIFWIGVIIVAMVLFFMYAESFATSVLNYLSGYNIYSRTFERMADSTLSESDARVELQAVSMKLIAERPLLGWGIGGECYTIGRIVRGAGDVNVGFSPHNGILQHMLYFGVLAGNVVNLWLMLPIFKLHHIKDEFRHGIILVACSAYFITTLYSSCDILLKPAVAMYIYLTYFYKEKRII